MQGSVEQFKANWQRPEAQYCHYTRGEPVNQIQFAFRQNWLEFAKIMEPLKPWAGKKSLEVGAGRGTMSMYFAENGFSCHLLDACSEPMVSGARAFLDHDLPSPTFECGDARKLPYDDGSFDVVFSYGLLEHFEDGQPIINEQFRVLKSGGVLISYVVPFEPNREFREAKWLSAMMSTGEWKPEIERHYYDFNKCYSIYKKAGLPHHSMYGFSVYPFPMLGPSNQFPFTLNGEDQERGLVHYMEEETRRNGWATSGPCQAFIAYGWKR